MTVDDKYTLPNLKLFKTGKVRSVYDLGEKLLIVASDRISAFDHVFKETIPNKGKVLTQISKFWFDTLNIPHHLISTRVDDFPTEAKGYETELEGRSMLVKKTNLIPIECVVRGYLAGSGWKEYQESRTVCGVVLPEGLKQGSKLPELIFTPAIKSIDGHDENITIEKMESLIGKEKTAILKARSLEIYKRGVEYVEDKGIIIADTKFEFGECDNGILLIDEVLTPDSSRFWPKVYYQEGMSPPSMDKQIVRDYVESTGWDKNSSPPPLPDEIIQKTATAYAEIEKIITGK